MSTEWVSVENEKSNLENILLYNKFARNPESFSVNVLEFKIPNSEDIIYYCFKKVNGWTPAKKNFFTKETCCTVCRDRLTRFCGYCANGNSLLLQNLVHLDEKSEDYHSLTKISKHIKEVNDSDKQKPNIVIIGENTFPEITEGYDEENNLDWHHPTIITKHTKQQLCDEYSQIINGHNNIVDERFSKLLNMKAHKSCKYIYDNLSKLERPEHWKSVLEWILKLQEICNGKSYDDMSYEEKANILFSAVFYGEKNITLTTPILYSFKTSNNLVDFITMSPEKVFIEMDSRSDPNTYQVSDLTRKLQQKATSLYTVSLIWGMSIGNTPFDDDLDLHIYVGEEEKHIYYNKMVITYQKRDWRLNFDANGRQSRTEEFPAENISCHPGVRFKIYVDNYRRVTLKRAIPFQIIIKVNGTDKEIIDGEWPVDRSCGKFMFIKEYIFDEMEDPELVMSKKQTNRAFALNGKWEENFGSPESSIVTLDEIEVEKYVLSVGSDKKTSIDDDFMGLAMRSKSERKAKLEKKYLSDYVDKMIDTIPKLIEYVNDNKKTLYIDPRNISPGYITHITTKNEEALKIKYSCVHYETQGRVPNKPTKLGNSRFDKCWFNDDILPHMVRVHSFVKIEDGWFMIIENTKLPVDEKFPIIGGFYPTILNSEFHSLRDRWTMCNTQIKPTMKPDGTPLIGSFLVNDYYPFVVDSKVMKIKLK